MERLNQRFGDLSVDIDFMKGVADELEEKGRAIYMKLDRECPILFYEVVGTSEVIKNIVRKKDKYRIRIEMTNLLFIKEGNFPEVYIAYSELKEQNLFPQAFSMMTTNSMKA
ncbi:MAG: hypothetical protein LBJ00_16900 [Planctomycetaceae bacterium]|jgi:hypothetical protein|nr:hypothetical protein [Planctomycetaceae bacterium]